MSAEMTKAQKRRSRLRQTAVRKAMMQTSELKACMSLGVNLESSTSGISTHNLLLMLLEHLNVLQFTFQQLLVPRQDLWVSADDACSQNGVTSHVSEQSSYVDTMVGDDYAPDVQDSVPITTKAVCSVGDDCVPDVQDSVPITAKHVCSVDVHMNGAARDDCLVDDVVDGGMQTSAESIAGDDVSDGIDSGTEHQHASLPAKPVVETMKDTSEDDLRFLAGLRGVNKQDAVLNLFINRSCGVQGVAQVLDDIEKYFEHDVERVASFFGMKFGFSTQGWTDCRTQLLSTASSMQTGPDYEISVGAILAHIRRLKSQRPPSQHDNLRERATELVRPRRKKRQKGK